MDVFHINRFKLVFVPMPSSTVNTQQQFNKAIQGITATNSIAYRVSNSKSIQE